MRHWWKAYLGAGGAVCASYLLLPEGVAAVVYVAVGLSSVAAIAAGTRGHRPARRAAWWLMAAGELSWVAGDAVFSTYQEVLHLSPFPSPADALYLAAYPLLAAGLVVLVRDRQRGPDVPALLDSAIVVTGLGLLSWVVLEGPVLRDTTSSPVARVVGAAYPAADILLLAVLVHLVSTVGGRTAAFRLLAGAGLLLVAADTAFALIAATSSYDAGPVDLLWLGSYVLWGTAALHPSMRALGSADHRAPGPTRGRLVALTTAVLLAPCTLAVELVAGTRLDAWAVVVASVLVFSLVVARMHGALREVTASVALRDRLRGDLAHQAAHDPLTALANRARVLDLVEGALHRGRRAGALVGLLCIDLDHFKAVNDAHGHHAGDDVLRTAAARMREAVRAGDAVGRLGGDEFVVLVEPLESEAALVQLAERLIDALSAPVTTGGREVRVGASIGIAVDRDGSTDAAALLHDADAAAQRAKAAGRGRAEVFDDALRRELAERAALEAAIATGLAQGEFVLHYQAVVDLASGAVQGREALVRWARPGHGLVPPDAFIPTAELSDLVCDLGRWVLHEATRQQASWTLADPAAFATTTVAVNISGRHLASSRIVPDVSAALASSGVPAEQLVLEITETVLVDEPTATAHLQALRDLGVAISIDDFGTGYTSVGQLRHLRADVLKIDKSFVGADDAGGRELVTLVVGAAHAFGLRVVAEGIETEDQLLALREIGCDAGQGYLFARPLPAADVTTPREPGCPTPGRVARPVGAPVGRGGSVGAE